MKKVLSIVLTLMLTAAMCAVAFADDAITGEWYCNLVKAQGMETDPSNMGMEMTLTVNEDGTANVAQGGEVAEGTWADNGDGTYTFDIDGEFAVTIDEEGSLVMANEEYGMELVFGRERVVSGGYEASPVVAAGDISEFNGTWNAVSMIYEGTEIPLTTLDAYVTLVIADGTIDYAQGDLGLNDETTTYEDISETLTGELVDGALSAGNGTLLLNLHEDGTLTNETVITLIFEKAE